MKKFDLKFSNIIKWFVRNREIAISIVLGIVVLFLFFSTKWSNSTKTAKSNSNDTVITSDKSTYNITSTQYADYIEDKIERALITISGVRKVSAIVMVESSPKINVYEEESNDVSVNVKNSTSTKRAVTIKNGNIETPLVLYEEFPKITGVLVIYNGDVGSGIKLNIIRALQTLFNIDASKVEVLEG